MYPNVHCSTINNSQDIEATKYPLTEKWIKKIYIYTTEYYSAVKSSKTMSLASTQMGLEIIILSEVNQKQISYDITCMWNLKN